MRFILSPLIAGLYSPLAPQQIAARAKSDITTATSWCRFCLSGTSELCSVTYWCRSSETPTLQRGRCSSSWDRWNFLKKTLGFLSFLFRLLLHSYPGADVEAPLLFLKVGLKLSLLMKHIVRAGSGDCESSLSCTAIILGCTERFFFTLHLITGYF